jgi:hypothetical protein
MVHTKSPRPILLFHQQHRRRESTCAWLNNSCLQHCLHLFFYFILQCWCISIWSGLYWSCPWDKGNSVVTCSSWRQVRGRSKHCLKLLQHMFITSGVSLVLAFCCYAESSINSIMAQSKLPGTKPCNVTVLP